MEPSDVYSIKFMHRGKEKEIMFPTYFAGWGEVALDAMSKGKDWRPYLRDVPL
jgi:hypothetical protein